VTEAIPLVDLGPLLGPPCAAREDSDRALIAAAAAPGFLRIRSVEAERTGAGVRSELLRIFELSPAETRPLWRQKFDARNRNLYRGWFPAQSGHLTSKEGIDLGPDIAYGPEVCAAGDPLREPTPVPPRERLPGWHEAAALYYGGMATLCGALMRSVARGLGLEQHFFDAAFERGLSTLRLLRYPVRTDLPALARHEAAVWRGRDGRERYLMGAPHVDSGFLTVVAQDGVEGLEVRGRDGAWLGIPSEPDVFVVNFGRVLERWSNGRIRATEHRVVGAGEERFSIAFFHEARADAVIRPLPTDAPGAFEPFVFGDYLWSTITQYVEFRGMDGLRRPAGVR